MAFNSVPAGIRDAIQRILAAANLPLTCRINFWGTDQLQVKCAGKASTDLTLQIRHPGVLRAVFLKGDPLVLAEAYLNGFFDFSGKLEEVIALFRNIPRIRVGMGALMRAWMEALMLPPLPQINWSDRQHDGSSQAVHTPERDRQSIKYHYDVGNAFYKLWLDPLLVYSCAHFEHPDMSLAEAQEAKLDLICRKLRLQPGETLLDVGCGWGALLRWAAQHYGVKGYGITLSEEQLVFNQQQNQAEGLADQIQVDLLDYRDLPSDGRFDKIVSVGMIEHVGLKNYPVYFKSLIDALKPGGLFLNHGINSANKWRGVSVGEQFINRYIFPDGELIRLSTTLLEAEKAGWEVVDVDAWRPHYAKTLRHWSKNLDEASEEAIALVGERQVLLWKLYLVGSTLAFESNDIGVNQTLLRKKSDRSWNLPLTRNDWLL